MSLAEQLQYLQALVEKARRDKSLDGEPPEGEPLRPLERARVEDCIEGCSVQHELGEFFLARQALPFGRPYGKFRIGDLSSSDLYPLNIFLRGASLPEPSQLVYLDTETTGLADDAGACAFLTGIGFLDGTQFVLQQFFLRDFAEERAALAALAEALAGRDGLVTYNGKTFDLPLLERRYAACGLASPLRRLTHLDVLHPARQLWKLRLGSCHLTNLERHVLGIAREGDIPGSEIPGVYFDYLRTGDARGLQPVFFHNALDVVTLAALTAELARVLSEAADEGSPQSLPAGADLLSLSRIFARAGDSARSLALCRRALEAGLAADLEASALWHLASQHKRRGAFDEAVSVWRGLAEREAEFAADSCRELAIHFERRMRDAASALRFTEAAIQLLKRNDGAAPARRLTAFMHRRERLLKRTAS